jgi:hypothetical protein
MLTNSSPKLKIINTENTQDNQIKRPIKLKIIDSKDNQIKRPIKLNFIDSQDNQITHSIKLKIVETKNIDLDLTSKPLKTISINSEKWGKLDILGFPSYQISTYGRIINIKTKRFLTGTIKKDGYQKVRLSENGKGKDKFVHQIMALVFIPIENTYGFTVDHIDRHRDNNIIENLRWATRTEQANNTTPTLKLGKRRHVNQYDLNGNFLKKWDHMSEIERLGIASITQVVAVCRGRRITTGGFIWKYADLADLDEEIWMEIPYEEFEKVFVSNKGRVKHEMEMGKPTKGYLHCGYWEVGLTDKLTRKIKAKRVHRLIISTFKGKQDDMQVNHIDGDPNNNNIENLEYMTQKQNVLHAIEIGLKDVNNAHTRKIIVINSDGEEIIFESIKSASFEYGISIEIISRICSGKIKQYPNIKFEYYEDVTPFII